MNQIFSIIIAASCFLSSEVLLNATSLPPKLPIRVHDFQTLIEDNYIFIDKTELIHRIVANNQYALITRPRGSGKTINLSMLRYFLDIKTGPKVFWPLHKFGPWKWKNIFTGLKISNHSDFCKRHQHRYAVIFVSFANVTGTTYEQLEKSVKKCIKEAILPHTKFKTRSIGTQFEGMYEKIMSDGPTELLVGALGDLVRFYEHKRTQTAVLIDAYDQPFYTALEADISKGSERLGANWVYWQTSEFMLSMLIATFKEANPTIGVLTGINTVTKADTFSGFNNVKTHSVLNDKSYRSDFGFSWDNVAELFYLTRTQVSEVKSWYGDSNSVGEVVYNPGSIIQCIHEGRFKSFWNGTSPADVIKSVFHAAGGYVLFQVDLLLAGKSVSKIVYDYLRLEYVFSEEEMFWTMLVHGGYLTAVPASKDTYKLRIPNKEMTEVFRDSIKTAEKEHLSEYEIFLNSIINACKCAENDEKLSHYTSSVQQHLNKYLSHPGSFFDFQKDGSVERYGVYFDGIFSGFKKRHYNVEYDVLGVLSKTIRFRMCKNDTSETPINIDFKFEDRTSVTKIPVSNSSKLPKNGQTSTPNIQKSEKMLVSDPSSLNTDTTVPTMKTSESKALHIKVKIDHGVVVNVSTKLRDEVPPLFSNALTTVQSWKSSEMKVVGLVITIKHNGTVEVNTRVLTDGSFFLTSGG